VAVASAGPYASLLLAPDSQPRQHLTTQFFTGRMPFLPPNQQRQCTEGQNSCQPPGDMSHEPGGRLPLLSAKLAVTLVTHKRAATSFAAW